MNYLIIAGKEIAILGDISYSYQLLISIKM
jgi:hypothetical protein